MAEDDDTLEELEYVSEKTDVKVDAELPSRLNAFARFGQRDTDFTDLRRCRCPRAERGTEPST